MLVNWKAADFSKPFQEADYISVVTNRELVSWQSAEESVTVVLQFNVERFKGLFYVCGN